MNQIELDEIKARAAAATPGPWEVSSNTPHICSHVIGDGLDTACLLHGNRWNDAAFIAHARADVPALVAEVERLTAALAVAEKDTERLIDAVAFLSAGIPEAAR